MSSFENFLQLWTDLTRATPEQSMPIEFELDTEQGISNVMTKMMTMGVCFHISGMPVLET